MIPIASSFAKQMQGRFYGSVHVYRAGSAALLIVSTGTNQKEMSVAR